MTKNTPIYAKPYLRIVAALQAYIRDNGFTEGGWLPSGRKMAAHLGASHLTYCKALSFLEREGVATAMSTRGHYVVPERLRIRKVGAVLGGGECVPYIAVDPNAVTTDYRTVMAAVIDTIAGGGYSLQLLQMPSPEQVFVLAEAYAMKGLVWIEPLPRDFSVIRAFRESTSTLPFIVASNQRVVMDAGLGAVGPDFNAELYERIQFVLARGHKRLLYIGDENFLSASGAIKLIHASGITMAPEDCFDGSFLEFGKVAELIVTRGYTGVVVNGGLTAVSYLFEALASLDDTVKPEVVLYSEVQYRNALRTATAALNAYPSRKITWLPAVPAPNPGVVAAERLLELMAER